MVQIMERSYEKKTFNISSQYSKLMKALIPSRKQTEFVNRAIGYELEKEQEKLQRVQALERLEKFKTYRQGLARSKKPSEEVLADMRQERSVQLENINSNVSENG